MDATVRNPRENDHRTSRPDLESFRSALDAGRIGIWAWDLRSKRMTWSASLEDADRGPEPSLVGAFPLDPQDLPAPGGEDPLAAIHRTLQTLAPCRLEYRLPGPAGRDERWFEATVTAVAQDGAAVQLLGTCREVSEHLRVNRETQVRARQQEALARLSEQALAESELQKFLNEVVATVGEILDVGLVKILELVPGDGLVAADRARAAANLPGARDRQAGRRRPRDRARGGHRPSRSEAGQHQGR